VTVPVTGVSSRPSAEAQQLTLEEAGVRPASRAQPDRAVLDANFSALLHTPAAKAAVRKDPFVQLEAAFLRNFVEAMLPKDEAGIFGGGLSGDYWRSMLADQIAGTVAASGTLGIAETLRNDFAKRRD
jgi:Rod binding domain-containing protein